MDGKELLKLKNALSKDPRVVRAVKRLDKGIGTYRDVNDIALRVGKRIAEEMGIEFSEAALTEFLTAGHGIIAASAEVAQTNLNRAAGIGLKPMVTKPPNYKISQTVATVAKAEPEAIPTVCANVLPSFMLNMVDDIQKYNADFQKDSGLHPIIRRTWSGSYPSHDTRHTDWCKDLAGEWEYGDQPPETFARHEGCECTVEYFPSGSTEGRITALAKYEVDREGVLWNTKEETLSDRILNARERKRLDRKYR